MSEVHSWAAAPSTLALELAFAAGAAAGAVFAAPIGRFLLIVLAAGAALCAVQDLFARPSLVADQEGVVVRAPWAPRRVEWRHVERVAVVTTRRLLVLHSLEIDAGDTLVLLTRRRLGSELADVLTELETIRTAVTVSPA